MFFFADQIEIDRATREIELRHQTSFEVTTILLRQFLSRLQNNFIRNGRVPVCVT